MKIDIVQEGQIVASVQGPDTSAVMADAMHYAFIYGQDGPVTVEGVTPEMWAKWYGPTTNREE